MIKMNKKIINIINDSNDFNYHLKENEKVIINYYNDVQNDIKISIIQNSNSEFNLNFFCFIKKDAKVYIDNKVLGNNNKCNVKIRAIALKNSGFFDIRIKANPKTKDNILIEDIKGINEEGTIILKPILEIETSEIDAEHYATVGSYNEDELFYLESKGISEIEAKKIIRNSLIYGMFDENFLNKIEGSKNE